MSNTSFPAGFAHGAQAPGARPAAALSPRAMASFISLVDALAVWLERGRERRTLARLDDRMLADLGISRAEAATEWAKPGWQR